MAFPKAGLGPRAGTSSTQATTPPSAHPSTPPSAPPPQAPGSNAQAAASQSDTHATTAASTSDTHAATASEPPADDRKPNEEVPAATASEPARASAPAAALVVPAAPSAPKVKAIGGGSVMCAGAGCMRCAHAGPDCHPYIGRRDRSLNIGGRCSISRTRRRASSARTTCSTACSTSAGFGNISEQADGQHRGARADAHLVETFAGRQTPPIRC